MKITADTLIADVLQINENAGQILTDFGMHCLGCAIAHQETVGEAAIVHGIDLDKLLEALNK
ncbi:MAG TPA: disulfide oxidoreductase [Clostridiales bacterium]|nr:disulfide oxidoreductase [Clostridiales bacterium]